MYSRIAMGLPGVLRARQSREKKHLWYEKARFVSWLGLGDFSQMKYEMEFNVEESEVKSLGGDKGLGLPGPLVWLPWTSGINSEDKEKKFLDS